MADYIIALDQGTTSSRAILFDHDQRVVGIRQQDIRQIFPHPGWVEQDPQDIWASTVGVLQELLAVSNISPGQISSIGITNQRETTVVWEKETGKPLYNAIVWQCRRTADFCTRMQEEGWEEKIQDKTGLVIDAYFSGTKLKWILDQVDPDRSRAKSGEILFGTIDTWLLWKFTEGRVHATDYTNASRTMLFNIQSLRWDEDILDYLDIPREMLPEVHPSGYYYGDLSFIQGVKIPINAMAGDQQAALYGQGCWSEGMVKNTYGTGCFLLMHTGEKMTKSSQGLVSTLACTREKKAFYALEGSIFIGGAVVQWLRDEMHMVEEAGDTDFFARKRSHNEGVYFVPAFTGLGAPYWDMEARGAIYGLTRGTNRAHIIRAGLEAIAYQTHDVVEAMEKDAGRNIAGLRVDGGASNNNFLMQFQADILDAKVERTKITETTALGVAYLAGLTSGFWENEEEILKQQELDGTFVPEMSSEEREANIKGWQEAIRRTLTGGGK